MTTASQAKLALMLIADLKALNDETNGDLIRASYTAPIDHIERSLKKRIAYDKFDPMNGAPVPFAIL